MAASAAVMWTVALIGLGKSHSGLFTTDAVLLSVTAAVLYWRSKKAA